MFKIIMGILGQILLQADIILLHKLYLLIKSLNVPDSTP